MILIAGYRTGASSGSGGGSGAFLADMKVGIQNRGLLASDRISDALHESDQVL
jgi:hypothetical protein